MENITSIAQAVKKGQGQVAIRGWCYRERKSNKLAFIIVRDASNIIQCVVDKSNVNENTWNTANNVNIETSLKVVGELSKDERAPTGFELHVKELEIIGNSSNYPITKDQSKEFLADNRHLWIRSRKMTSILKIRSTVFGAIHEYFRNNGFYEWQSPIFMSSQCEGGSTLFEVGYFGKTLYLTQTWQLHAEAGIFALEKLYTVAPMFRAEKSKTFRHLTECWLGEMECAWVDFNQLMDHYENLMKHIVKKVLDNNTQELKILGRDLSKLTPTVKKPFIRMTYTEAVNILKEKCSMPIEWGEDLGIKEERALTKLYDVPIFVTHFPKGIKAFYMKIDKDDPRTVQGADLLAPEGYGEIIGGSIREEDPKIVEEQLRNQGEDPKDYGWYMDLRKYGSVPHGGFGLGIDRAILWICKLDTIKDAVAFPRTVERFTP